MSARINVAIAGTGNIAGPYAADIPTYDELNLVGVTDIDTERAQKFAADRNIKAYGSLDELLADPGVDLLVNLTTHTSHRDVSAAALNAGKHVYSEKPLATTYADAAGLVTLADEKGLRLACSPFTLMGEAQQTAWKLIREGKLGQVRAIFAEVNWGRIEGWHPAPGGFYAIGALYDVGVYPLTILAAIFGPVQRVTAYGTVLSPDRVTKEGVPFHIDTPDFVVSMLEFANGVVCRLTTDFYVANRTSRQTGIEFHGDVGSLWLESWHNFDAKVQYAEFEHVLEDVELVRPPHSGNHWGRGVWETATALLAGRPHRFTGELGAHINEVLEAASTSARTHQPVELHSTFVPPTPMEWAL